MSFKIICGDITRIKVKVIVNAANSSLLGGGGVDGAIHSAAGAGLLAECRTLGSCKTGEAKLTKGYNLPAQYVLHTVGPIWRDGLHNEPQLLAACYDNCLELAKQHGLTSLAFPLISAGVYGYPKYAAFRIAVDRIKNFLRDNELQVSLVLYGAVDFLRTNDDLAPLRGYIEETYEPSLLGKHDFKLYFEESCCLSLPDKPLQKVPTGDYYNKPNARKLSELINNRGETFTTMLLRLIDEKGLTDVQTYKRANIDRKLFSKIRSNINYRPSKVTAVALAIALRLNLDETEDLLRHAGFALSNSNTFDLIIQYFIEQRIFDIFQINEALFAFEQELLGA